MPAFEKKLTSEEVAQVLTFVRGTWGNSAVPVTVRQGLRCAMGLSAADLSPLYGRRRVFRGSTHSRIEIRAYRRRYLFGQLNFAS